MRNRLWSRRIETVFSPRVHHLALNLLPETPHDAPRLLWNSLARCTALESFQMTVHSRPDEVDDGHCAATCAAALDAGIRLARRLTRVHLDWSHWYVDENTLVGCWRALFLGLPALQAVNLSFVRCGIDDDSLSTAVAALFEHNHRHARPQHVALDLADNELARAGVQDLMRWLRHVGPHTLRLDLSRNALSTSSTPTDLFALPTVETLDVALGHNRLGDAVWWERAAATACLERCTRLCVDASRAGLRDATCVAALALRAPRCRFLRIGMAHHPHLGHAALSRGLVPILQRVAPRLLHLALDLHDCGAEARTVATLVQPLGDHPLLQSLELDAAPSGCSGTHADRYLRRIFRCLHAMPHLTGLRLDLGHPRSRSTSVSLGAGLTWNQSFACVRLAQANDCPHAGGHPPTGGCGASCPRMRPGHPSAVATPPVSASVARGIRFPAGTCPGPAPPARVSRGPAHRRQSLLSGPHGGPVPRPVRRLSVPDTLYPGADRRAVGGRRRVAAVSVRRSSSSTGPVRHRLTQPSDRAWRPAPRPPARGSRPAAPPPGCGR